MEVNFLPSPLVWFTDDQLLESTPLQWNESYEAFISTQLEYQSGTVITAYSSQKTQLAGIPSASSREIKAGQKMTISDARRFTH